MLEKTSTIEFLRTGLSRYADARETVDYFETATTKAIVAAFEAKANWKNFQPIREAGSLQSGNATGSVDRFIHAFLAGTVPSRNEGKEKMWIYLGLYWKPPRRPNARVVAATHAVFEKGIPVPLLDAPSRNKQIGLGPLFRKNDRRLWVEPGDDFDPAEIFALLLDSVDEALAVNEAAGRTALDAP